MKLLQIIPMAFILPICVSAQNIFKGKVLDEQSLPLPFANVVLIDQRDSAYIVGTVTKNDGSFTIETDRNHCILKLSRIGYNTILVKAKHGNLGNIIMQSDTLALKELIVHGHIRTFKQTSEGIQTNVEGTALSKLGTGEDVLIHIPGIIKKQDAFEVFGKGTPLIYINGRLMRDPLELDQMKSENIKNIELITTPGAKYDASVKAVVKIRTKTAQGEGFGFDFRSSYFQSENTDIVEQLNWNYRHAHLDVFGTSYYGIDNGHFPTTTTTLVQVDTLWRQNFAQDYTPQKQSFGNTIGANYLLNDTNSIGIRYTLTLRPDNQTTTSLNSNVTANNNYFDELNNVICADVGYRPAHLLNAYYKGKIGKAEIDFNTDYLYNRKNNHTIYSEQSTSMESRIVSSDNTERNELFASRLTVDFPLLGGGLIVGTEYTHTNRNDDYINPEKYVPTSFAKLKESHIAPFAEYRREISLLQFAAGLRYEWVNFDYYENNLRLNGQSRSFGNLFPSLSAGMQIGDVQMQLSYAAKTRRPTYQQLSNNVTYGNRFLLQSGNPLLNHEYIHDFSLIGVWDFLQLSIGYNNRRNAIIYWAEQQKGNSAVTRVTHKNIPSLKSISAQVALSPSFGIWSPEISIGMQKQWFTLYTDIETYKLNKPIFQLNIDNHFDFGHGWVVSADTYLTTKGHSENCYDTRNKGAFNFSITKPLLNNHLSVQLKVSDLFHTEKQGVLLYAGAMQSEQISWYDSREFSFTLRYKFNTTRSKYKGTGAGLEEKNRL